MTERKTSTERLLAFTDAVFAVIITSMVLELKPPAEAKLSALLPVWPWIELCSQLPVCCHYLPLCGFVLKSQPPVTALR